MGKKTGRSRGRLKNKNAERTAIVVRYILVGFGCLMLALAGKTLLSATTTIHVLGISTGPVLLTDKGSDAGGVNSSGEATNGLGDSSETPIPSNGQSNTAGSSAQETATPSTSTPGSTLVDCVGPDGRHFTIEYHTCQELNQKWGNTNFTFTSLSKSGSDPTNTQVQPSEVLDPTRETHTTIPIETQDHHGTFTLTQAETLKLERDDGQVIVNAQEENGQETKLDEKDAIEKINTSLASAGVEVSASAHNMLEVKKAGVAAETVFPLSVDPIRHVLTVATPAGVKEVAVLPDQAVQALLRIKLMTNIQSQASTDSAQTTQLVTLTQLNNDAVFEVQGVSQKRLLGLFPVGFAKTAFVSATTGQVVKVDETSFNQFLEALSF